MIERLRALEKDLREESRKDAAHGANKEWAEWLRERYMASASAKWDAARRISAIISEIAEVEAVAEVVQREPYLDGSPNPMKKLQWNLPNCEDDLPAGTKLYPRPVAELGQEVGAVADALTLSAPPKVWLQVDTAADDEDEREPIPRDCWEHMSWCHESIGGHEVVYIREDLTSPAHTSEARDAGETCQFFASGPEGSFFAKTLADAENLIDIASFDRDEWTVTDLHDAAMRQEGGE